MAKRQAGGDGAAEKVDAVAHSKLMAPLPVASSTDSAPLGSWSSETGKCRIFKDPITNRLAYEESIGEGRRLHGWLDPVTDEKGIWRGTLALLEAGKPPWYGPSFGPAPETVGSIQVRPIADSDPAAMETQIKVADEDEEWQKPVRFKIDTAADEPANAPKIQWTEDKEEDPRGQGQKKRPSPA
mmetsp:Transcript_49075/g.110383  ORF Transcript_49075/g.110383 Transcript_49075/m.110383 type:complete len:184 (+) Transcript_49075:66-617(+)